MINRAILAGLTGAAVALAASPATAQTTVEEAACSATYTSGGWRLHVDFSDNPFDGQMVRYRYTHEPSGFWLNVLLRRGEDPAFGFEVAGLLDTPEIEQYFEDMPTEPYDPDAVFPPNFLGELTFMLVDKGEPWSWIAIGELAYGFDPFVQERSWIFLPGPQNERNRELVSRLTRFPSNDIEMMLEFRPELSSATVLRRIPLSNTGLVELARQSPSWVEAILERCPAAGGGD